MGIRDNAESSMREKLVLQPCPQTGETGYFNYHPVWYSITKEYNVSAIARPLWQVSKLHQRKMNKYMFTTP